jgi:hypothetical protein
MGQTTVIRFGYGVKLTEGSARSMDEYDDIEFFLDDNYPLLEDGSSGNAWGGKMETWVLVKSTLITEYEYGTIKLNPDNFTVPEDGLAQLTAFMTDTPLAVGAAQWVILSSVG